jgi:WD40 repeat protein
VYSLNLSADCRFLAGVAGVTSMPGVAWRYDLARDRFSRILTDRADLHSVRLSPDGKRAYATGGTAEPELTCRDLVAGKELWTVRLKGVGQLRAVSADGRRLAVSDGDGVRVFDAADGKVALTAPVDSSTPPGLWGIDLSPDGGRLALAVDREVALWDAATGKVKHRLPHAARLVAFAPDGRSLLTVAAWVQRWDVETGRPAFPAPILDKPVAPRRLHWSADGNRLLTLWPGDQRGDEADWRPDLLAVWDVRRMDVAWRQASKPTVLEAALDRAGSVVSAYREDSKVHRWSLGPGGAETDFELKPPPLKLPVHLLEFLPDGGFVSCRLAGVACADVYSPTGRHASRQLTQLPAHTDYRIVPATVRPGVLVYSDGARLDLVTGRPLPPLDTRASQFVLRGQPILGGPSVVASRIQISGPWGGPAVEGLVWDAVTGGQIVRLMDRIPDWALAALSPDGRWLAHVTGDVVEVADLATLHPSADPAARTRLRLPAADAKALAFSPDATRLATAHADGTVLVWELPPGHRDPWKGADVDTLWADLGTPAADAWRALWHLLAYPGPATELLRARAKPIPAWTDTPEQIAKLDHPKYAVREEAARELARRGAVVEGDLRAALQKTTSAEQRERLEGLLNKLNYAVAPDGEVLRGLRAVWLLERLGTAEAKKLLERLADGASGSRVTLEAKAAVERLK